MLRHRHEERRAAHTVMPQIYGWNTSTSPDGDPHLELNDHEKLNATHVELLIRHLHAYRAGGSPGKTEAKPDGRK